MVCSAMMVDMPYFFIKKKYIAHKQVVFTCLSLVISSMWRVEVLTERGIGVIVFSTEQDQSIVQHEWQFSLKQYG